ncbi:hypothetical protein D3C73_548000 [compost metagenome]
MREGLIPTVLGTAVTATGWALQGSKYKTAATAVMGFGLAHVVLGAIDLVEHRNQQRF